MCDFQRGDVVVAVRGPSGKPLRILSEGTCYTVVEIRYLHDGEGLEQGPWSVQVSELGHHEHETETHRYLGFGSVFFRRVYRPKADLISKLLEPIKEGAR